MAHHHDVSAAAWAVAAEEDRQKAEGKKLRMRRFKLYLTGRVLLASLFIISAVVKMVGFEATREALADVGLHDGRFLLTLAIGIELMGGLALALGYQVRYVATALISYMTAVTLLMHSDLTVVLNRAFALLNLALAGALLMLVAHGAGTHSVDRWLAHRRRPRAV